MSSRRCRVFSSLLIPSPSSRIHGQDAATPAPRREEERQRDRERGRDRSAASCAPLADLMHGTKRAGVHTGTVWNCTTEGMFNPYTATQRDKYRKDGTLDEEGNFLADPNVTWLAILITGLISGILFMSLLGGSWKTRLITFGSAFVAALFGACWIFKLTPWFPGSHPVF